MTSHVDHHRETFEKTIFGFWLYIMSDCVLFGTLFATYAVLHTETFGGPTAKELFSLPSVLLETLILLTSSFTCGIAMLYAKAHQKIRTIGWFFVTFLLGAAFLTIEIKEFHEIVQAGHSWATSAFLSSFFTLVGTHGLHITFGLIWIGTMLAQLIVKGITPFTFRRLTCLSLFWHFLDIIWIFIFTIVYLMGVVV